VRFSFLLQLGTAGAVSLSLGVYEEKVQPQPIPNQEPGAVSLPAGTNAPLPMAARTGDQYPYYGNTPEEMIPFRTVEPYYRYWTTRLPFLGPGRDYPDPTDLKSLKIGLLSPATYGPEGKRGARTRRGVELAVEEANAARQSGQLPFEIVYREDAPQWGSAANLAVEFKDNEVLGFLGTVDGDATHVALRVALKIETYLINTSDPDPTLTETQIPWLTRVFPEERQQCFRLADLVIRRRGCQRVAVLRESSRPGRMGVMHFLNYIRRLGHPAVAHLLFQAGSTNIDEQLAAIKGANPDAILFYGQPEDVGRYARLCRRAGLLAPFFGFDRLKEDGYAKNAGDAAEGTTITYFFDPDRPDPPWVEFVKRFEKRWAEKPDVYAAYGYDGAKLMIQAIEHAGPNRFRIRDYLANLDEWNGATGHMIFDGRWDNIAPMVLAEYKGGAWHFSPTHRIGLLLPPGEPEAENIRRGVALGIEHVNRRSDVRFELVVRGRPGQWGTDGDETATLVLDDQVSGVIAPPAGAASHQVLQVAGRTRVPVVSLCPDSSVTGAGVPWAVRVVARTDEEAAAVFLAFPFVRRWSAVVPADRPGRETTHDLQEAANRGQVGLNQPVRLPTKLNNPEATARSLLADKPDAVLLWVDAAQAGTIARHLRRAEFKGTLAGPGRLRSGAFLSHAAEAAEGLVIPDTVLEVGDAAARVALGNAYAARHGGQPEVWAAFAFDAAQVLAEVLRRAGGQAAFRQFPIAWDLPGATGPLKFDAAGNRRVTFKLLQCRGARFVPFHRGDEPSGGATLPRSRAGPAPESVCDWAGASPR